MKKFLILLLVSLSTTSYSQILSGELKDSGRHLISDETFILDSHVDGYAKYEITVNEQGAITGLRLLETDIKSTPARYYLENHVKKMKFQKDVLYPKFHRGVVKFTLRRSS